MKIQELGIKIGSGLPGMKNCITDVAGVKVGHVTLDYAIDEEKGTYACTGVTAILPHSGNMFREKVTAASYVINGFGKTTGLVQVNELGLLESPIMLTNTFGVPAVTQGTLQYMLEQSEEIGDSTGTVNIVVGECNDSYLNSIREMPVLPEHAIEAIKAASNENVQEGAVGAGKGMVCFGYKGGIGTSSRIIKLEDDHTYTVGCLVLSNFGKQEEFVYARNKQIQEGLAESSDGSIIIVLATDVPLSDRQLQRVAKRCGIGLGRTGSHFDHGSGDIVIAFSTAQKIQHHESGFKEMRWQVREEHPIMRQLFISAAEATEEAILNSLLHATDTKGRNGHVVKAYQF